MTFSASISIADLEAANAALDALGFGPDNFSVPLRSGTGAATHAGFHSWTAGDFYDAVVALPYDIQVTVDGTLDVNFAAHVAGRALEWSNPVFWFENPVMIGDQRAFGGKTWESLTSYNVWQPPVGWRQVVSTGFPDWVQPVGSVDAYKLGERVTYDGRNWVNTGSNANVWAPGVFGWTVI